MHCWGLHYIVTLLYIQQMGSLISPNSWSHQHHTSKQNEVNPLLKISNSRPTFVGFGLGVCVASAHSTQIPAYILEELGSKKKECVYSPMELGLESRGSAGFTRSRKRGDMVPWPNLLGLKKSGVWHTRLPPPRPMPLKPSPPCESYLRGFLLDTYCHPNLKQKLSIYFHF